MQHKKERMVRLACVVLVALACIGCKNEAKTFTVTYNGNGNTFGSVPESQTKIQNTNLTLQAPSVSSFAKTDNIFSGWNTAADGSGTAYKAGATYSTDENVTLYAQWKTPRIVLAGNCDVNSTQTGQIRIDETVVSIGENLSVSALSISGDDIYVAGVDSEGHFSLWKNNAANKTELSTETFYLYSLFFDGSNIHASGGYIPLGYTDIVAATYDTNSLKQLSQKYSFAKDGLLYNGSVYLVGSDTITNNGTDYLVGTVWKDNIVDSLLSRQENSSSSYNGITVLGNDIYIAGVKAKNNVNQASLWKNGTEVTITTPADTNSSITALANNGQHVYAAGSQNKPSSPSLDNGKIWNENDEVLQTFNEGDNYSVSLMDICVLGEDIYVVGQIELSNTRQTTTKVWKNGTCIKTIENSSFNKMELIP